jgi:uncharacterized membrane protein
VLNAFKRVVAFLAGNLKRGAVAVAGYLMLKVVGYSLRFLIPKEEATKLVLYLILGYIATKVLEDIPKTSEPTAA